MGNWTHLKMAGLPNRRRWPRHATLSLNLRVDQLTNSPALEQTAPGAAGEVKQDMEAKMNNLEAVLVVMSLFAVRFAVPLAITVGATTLMNRWLNSWTPEG